ncbi:MAG: iron chaperone [Chitinophagaceae bacterium]
MPAMKPASIDDYIAGFPKETQTVLNQVRDTIKNAVPEAEETISYAIPAFILNKTYLVYFAGYKHHISLYPAPKGNEAFEKEIAGYRSGKGTIQFPLDKPLPLALVTKIVRYNLKENLKRQKDH